MPEEVFLWLDDIRDPWKHGIFNAAWAKTYEQAIGMLMTGDVIFASLDHDLGACDECVAANAHIGDMKTPETTFYNHCPHAKSGYEVVCWMEENGIWPKDGVRVHSMNPVGKARMQQVIDRNYR